MAWLLAGLEGRIIRWSVGWLVASCRRLPPLSSCFLALANPISFPPAPWPPHFVGQPIRGQPSDGKFSLLSYPLLSASSVFQQGKNANAKKLPDDDGMNVGWVPGVSAASLLFFFFAEPLDLWVCVGCCASPRLASLHFISLWMEAAKCLCVPKCTIGAKRDEIYFFEQKKKWKNSALTFLGLFFHSFCSFFILWNF